MGITAISWNSRTENPAFPPGVGSRLRSLRTWRAMAVDD
jgi:hypothetical protein